MSFRQAITQDHNYNGFFLYIFESNLNKSVGERNITILGNIISDLEEELKYNPLEITCYCYFYKYSKGPADCSCENKNPLIKPDTIILIDNKILSGIPRYELLTSSSSIINTYTPDPIIYESDGCCINLFKATFIEGDSCWRNGEFSIRGNFSHSYDRVKEFILFITYPPAKAKCEIKNGKIKCISGNTFENKMIMIEQQSAYSPYLEDEYFVITSIKSLSRFTCIKGNVSFPTEAEITEVIKKRLELMKSDKPILNNIMETDKVNPESTTIYETYNLIPSDNTDKTIPDSNSSDTSSQTSLIISTPSSSTGNNSTYQKPNQKSKSKGIIIIIIAGSVVVVTVVVILIVLGIKGKLCNKNKNKDVNKKPEEEPYDSSNTINNFGPQK